MRGIKNIFVSLSYEIPMVSELGLFISATPFSSKREILLLNSEQNVQVSDTTEVK